MISFVEGSLFSSSQSFSLAQCISGDVSLGMFKGISKQFMEKFPELEKIRLYEMLQLGEVLPREVGGAHLFIILSPRKSFGASLSPITFM